MTDILGNVKSILYYVKKTNTTINSVNKKLSTLTKDNQLETSCHIVE